MSDILKDIRWVMRIQFFASIVLLIFILSPTDEERLSGALSELNTLSSIDLSHYELFAYTFATYREAGNSGYVLEKMKGEMFEDKVSDQLKIIIPVYVKTPRNNGTVKNHKNFLEGQNYIAYANFSNGPISYYQGIINRVNESGDSLKLKAIRLEPIGRYAPILLDLDNAIYGVDFSKSSDRKFEGHLIYSMGKHNVTMQGGGVEHFHTEELMIDLSHKWLIEYFPDKAKLLYGNIEDPSTALPNVAYFLSSLSDLTLGKAIRKIDDDLKKSKRNLTISGLSIPGELVSWGGPTIVVLISLFLVAHLKGARNTLIKSTSDEIQISWLPLYSDPVSQLLSFFMNIVAPAASVVMVAIFVWPNTNFNLYVGGGLLLITAIILSFLYIESEKFRKHIEIIFANKAMQPDQRSSGIHTSL